MHFRFCFIALCLLVSVGCDEKTRRSENKNENRYGTSFSSQLPFYSYPQIDAQAQVVLYTKRSENEPAKILMQPLTTPPTSSSLVSVDGYLSSSNVRFSEQRGFLAPDGKSAFVHLVNDQVLEQKLGWVQLTSSIGKNSYEIVLESGLIRLNSVLFSSDSKFFVVNTQTSAGDQAYLGSLDDPKSLKLLAPGRRVLFLSQAGASYQLVTRESDLTLLVNSFEDLNSFVEASKSEWSQEFDASVIDWDIEPQHGNLGFVFAKRLDAFVETASDAVGQNSMMLRVRHHLHSFDPVTQQWGDEIGATLGHEIKSFRLSQTDPFAVALKQQVFRCAAKSKRDVYGRVPILLDATKSTVMFVKKSGDILTLESSPCEFENVSWDLMVNEIALNANASSADFALVYTSFLDSASMGLRLIRAVAGKFDVLTLE